MDLREAHTFQRMCDQREMIGCLSLLVVAMVVSSVWGELDGCWDSTRQPLMTCLLLPC